MHGETNSGENHLRNFNMHLDAGTLNERLKYKIKIIAISSSEFIRLEIMRQCLILHMTKPNISTSVPFCIISFTQNLDS